MATVTPWCVSVTKPSSSTLTSSSAGGGPATRNSLSHHSRLNDPGGLLIPNRYLDLDSVAPGGSVNVPRIFPEEPTSPHKPAFRTHFGQFVLLKVTGVPSLVGVATLKSRLNPRRSLTFGLFRGAENGGFGFYLNEKSRFTWISQEITFPGLPG